MSPLNLSLLRGLSQTGSEPQLLYQDREAQSLADSAWHPVTLSQALTEIGDRRILVVELRWRGSSELEGAARKIVETWCVGDLSVLNPITVEAESVSPALLRQVPRGNNTRVSSYSHTTLYLARPLRDPQTDTEIMLASRHMSTYTNLIRTISLL